MAKKLMNDPRRVKSRLILGQGLVEYCLILLLVAVLVVIALRSLGTSLESCYFEPLNSSACNAAKP